MALSSHDKQSHLVPAIMKKIVLKVIIMCSKCKACIIKIIAKIHGVISIIVDVEKSTVTVIGDVDAAVIVNELRKAGKSVDIESVGPHKKEEKKDDKKDGKKDDKKECKPLPPCCNTCKPVPAGNIVWYEHSSVCTIL